MTRHSKNNTASSVFTYAERKKLTHYGAQSTRLGSNSLRRFDACSLCLSQAQTPVACSKGHLFCKECVVKDLIDQKAALASKAKLVEAVRKEEERAQEEARAQARERVLREFERGQGVTSLLGKRKERDESSKTTEEEEPAGKKRKFEFDHEAAQALAKEAEDAAIKQLELEQNEARKAKLPDFWLPSLTPDAPKTLISLKDVKLQPQCHAAKPEHPLLMKHLTPVSFTLSPSTSDSKNDSEAICPSCKKAISNSIRIFLIKGCSHVVCKSCTDSLVTTSKQCVACDGPAKPKDVIELVREGTGFAGGGMAEAKKSGTAFQG